MNPIRSLLVPLLAALCMNACSGAGACPKPFVAEQWRGAAHGTSSEVLRQRRCMHESLIDEHLKPGTRREDVLGLLGAPNYQNPAYLSYLMHAPNDLSPDYEELRIMFDDAGRLAAVKILPG